MEPKYMPVCQNTSDAESADTLTRIPEKPRQSPLRTLCALLSITLLGSLTTNFVFIHREFVKPWLTYDRLPSKYVGLRRDFPVEIVPHNDFDSLNRTLQDQAWNQLDLKQWDTVVALDDDYVSAQGLLHAQRWPWDHNKGIYILSGGHNIHCVHILRTWINEDHDGVLEEDRQWDYPHVLHCLNTVREVVMCDADDTPLYTGSFYKNAELEEPKAGTGVVKMCRNWSQMMSWARTHSACYSYQELTDDDGTKQTDLYKFCPDGSRPWEQVETE